MTGQSGPSLLDIARAIRDTEQMLNRDILAEHRAELDDQIRHLRADRDARLARIAYAERSDADMWRDLTAHARASGTVLAVAHPFTRHAQLLALELGRREAITRHGLTEAESGT